MKENIKKIAESLGYEIQGISNGGIVYLRNGSEMPRRFNPYTSDSDAFKVLEALVKTKRLWTLGEWETGIYVCGKNGSKPSNGKDLKRSMPKFSIAKEAKTLP